MPHSALHKIWHTGTKNWTGCWDCRKMEQSCSFPHSSEWLQDI